MKLRTKTVLSCSALFCAAIMAIPVLVGAGSAKAMACKQGFVWREATNVDQVCVTQASREKVRQENRIAPSRTAGGGAYGPDTCKQGFVWREATGADKVCVSRERRSEVRSENAQAGQRRQPGTVQQGQADGQFIACPLNQANSGLVGRLTYPWWSTPQRGRLESVHVSNVGGQPTLVCAYRAYNRTMPVMRRFPKNVKHCNPQGSGFRCR